MDEGYFSLKASVRDKKMSEGNTCKWIKNWPVP